MAPDIWIYFLAVLAVILLPGMDMAFVMLNPKAYAFMFALFPAFVRSDARSLLTATQAWAG